MVSIVPGWAGAQEFSVMKKSTNQCRYLLCAYVGGPKMHKNLQKYPALTLAVAHSQLQRPRRSPNHLHLPHDVEQPASLCELPDISLASTHLPDTYLKNSIRRSRHDFRFDAVLNFLVVFNLYSSWVCRGGGGGHTLIKPTKWKNCIASNDSELCACLQPIICRYQFTKWLPSPTKKKIGEE